MLSGGLEVVREVRERVVFGERGRPKRAPDDRDLPERAPLRDYRDKPIAGTA